MRVYYTHIVLFCIIYYRQEEYTVREEHRERYDRHTYKRSERYRLARDAHERIEFLELPFPKDAINR